MNLKIIGKYTLSLATLFYFYSCIQKNKPLAMFDASSCLLKLADNSKHLKKIILFSNVDSINNREILMEHGTENTYNLCSILNSKGIAWDKVNLISLEIGKSNKELNSLVLESEKIKAINSDTTYLLYEPRE